MLITVKQTNVGKNITFVYSPTHLQSIGPW